MSIASLQTSLVPQGFHFVLSTTINIPSSPARDDCTFQLLYDLDPHVYADQYELAQCPHYTSLLWGNSDLERPVFALDPTSSVLLVTADKSHIIPGRASTFTLDVPLHARYGRPSQSSEMAFGDVELKRPVGFFACANDHPAPVPSILRPYTSFLEGPTLPLYLVKDTSPDDSLRIVIPVGVRQDLAWVDIGTAVTMIVMSFYLLFTSIRTARRLASKSHAKTD